MPNGKKQGGGRKAPRARRPTRGQVTAAKRELFLEAEQILGRKFGVERFDALAAQREAMRRDQQIRRNVGLFLDLDMIDRNLSQSAPAATTAQPGGQPSGAPAALFDPSTMLGQLLPAQPRR